MDPTRKLNNLKLLRELAWVGPLKVGHRDRGVSEEEMAPYPHVGEETRIYCEVFHVYLEEIIAGHTPGEQTMSD